LELEKTPLSKPKTGDWLVGVCPVITKLWKDKVIYALVTASKNAKGGQRLFLCTKNPREIPFNLELCANEIICEYGKENLLYLPLA